MTYPCILPQVILLLSSAESEEYGGDTRRWLIRQEEWDRAVEGHQPSSRTSIRSFVPGETGRAGGARATQNHKQATHSHVSDQNVRHRLYENGWRLLVETVFTAQQRTLAFNRLEPFLKGADTSPAAGLRPFECPVQHSICNVVPKQVKRIQNCSCFLTGQIELTLCYTMIKKWQCNMFFTLSFSFRISSG